MLGRPQGAPNMEEHRIAECLQTLTQKARTKFDFRLKLIWILTSP